MNDKEKLDKIEELCKTIISNWFIGEDVDYYEWKVAKSIIEIIGEKNEVR